MNDNIIPADTAEIRDRAQTTLMDAQRLVRQCIDLGIDLEIDGECPLAGRRDKARAMVPVENTDDLVRVLMVHIVDILAVYLADEDNKIEMRGDCPLFEKCMDVRGLTVDLESKTVFRHAEP